MVDAGSSDSLSWFHPRNLAKLEREDSEGLAFRRTLLETPSGFAIFDVREDVLVSPEHIWAWFSNPTGIRQVVYAIGFVKIEDKSIAWNTNDGPGKELSRLITKRCRHRTDLIVQDAELKKVIEDKLEVKCLTIANEDIVGELMWGLKYVVRQFLPQERDKLTDEYYLPLSNGLQRALNKYGLDVEVMDRNYIHYLGYLDRLVRTSSSLPKMLRLCFDHHVCWIGKHIESDLLYATVLAQILVPEYHPDSPKLLSGDLEEKVKEVGKKVEASGKVIDNKDVIVAVLKFLSTFEKKKKLCSGVSQDFGFTKGFT